MLIAELGNGLYRNIKAAAVKDNIAICGYHGWHDWYLSANLNTDDNLSEHLLPGLNQGVPKNLENSVFPLDIMTTKI